MPELTKRSAWKNFGLGIIFASFSVLIVPVLLFILLGESHGFLDESSLHPFKKWLNIE